MLERIEAMFARPRAVLWLGAAAVALSLPALRLGLQNDDHLLALSVARGAPAWDLFDFRALSAPAARESGFVAWWADPRLSQHFFRPLASLLHTLEFTFWPDAPWLMLLVNTLIYGGCVVLAAALYRRLAPSSAGLSALLFAVDPTHAISVGWISGRNTLLALLFALAALLLHLHARDRGQSRWSWASSAALLCALLSAEAGVWALALLLAYALVMEPGSWVARLSTIGRQLALGTAWAFVYWTCGFGLHGASSYYRDTSSPLRVLAAGVLDLPLWSASLFGVEGVGIALFLPEHWAQLAILPVAAFVLWLVLPGLRTSQVCRMFALATLLCLLPLLFTLPNSRVLLGPNFGAIGWIACVVAARERGELAGKRWRGRLLLWANLGPGLLFPFGLSGTYIFERGTQALAAVVSPSREVVLVRSPVELLSGFTLGSLERRGRPTPDAIHQLYAGSSELWIERKEPRALEISVARGWGFAPVERLACAADAMPRAGREIRVRGMTVRVLESTADGRPQRVRFTFPSDLEAPERQWLAWQEGGPAAWRPPKLGERSTLAALPFQRALGM
jgi:hypothetical protein